jgi:LAO/AO transport system kinase
MPFLAAGGIVPAANAAQSAGRNRHGWNEQMDNDADSILATLQGWRAAGKAAALATVVSTWGSSPRPEGSHLAVDADGHFVGSVSGGCIEGAVIDAAARVMASGRPQLLEFGVSDEQAWQVGLACGGRVQVFVEPVE